METGQPRAVVTTDANGTPILIDPVGAAVARAIAKHNCRSTFDVQRDRVAHFANRIRELGRSPAEAVVVLINVDDVHGRDVADALMPGHDWQAVRDRGEVPFARGLAGREGIQGCLDAIDEEAAKKLRELDGVAVVVIDYGTAEVFPA